MALACVSINVFTKYNDGIDDQFMVSVAIFVGGGLTTMVAESDIYGPVPDGFNSTQLLPFRIAGYTSDNIDGSVLYLNHSVRNDRFVIGGGNDNCNGTISVLFTFSDGSGYQTQYYPFAIGNHNVSRDTSITISHPAQTQAVNLQNPPAIHPRPHPDPLPRPPHGIPY